MKRQKELLNNTVILAIGQFVPNLISLFFLPILTRTFTSEEYGIYDLVWAINALVLPCFSFQIQQAVFRFLLKADTEEKKKDIITNTYAIFAMTSILYIILCIVLNRLYFSITTSVLIVLLFYFNSLFRIDGMIVRGLGNNRGYSFASVIYAISYIIIALLLLFVLRMGVDGIVLASTVAHILSCLFLHIKNKSYRYITTKKISKTTIFKLLKYSLPIVPSSISIWVINFTDRLIITSLLGVASNGIYSVANKFPNIYTKIYTVFNLAWTENASKSFDEGDYKTYYSEISNQMLRLFVGAISFLMSMSFVIYHFIIGSDYVDGYRQVPILYLGVLLNSFVAYYGGIYIALGKTKSIGITSAIGAVVNIVINVLFVRRIGLYAASISTVVAYLLILIYRIIAIHKCVKIRYDLKMAVISFAIIVCEAVLSSFYDYKLCLVALLVAVGYNAVFNKKEVGKFFKYGMSLVKR